VLADMAAWAKEGLSPSVAVNVSTRMFDDGQFSAQLVARAGAAGVAPEMVIVEVTESAAVGSAETTVAELRSLRDAGFRISVDDYGTGQSTLTYLRNFPAHEIKIDQAFIRKMLTDSHDHILVRSTIDLAHALKLSVVAEGIEDELTLDLLRDMGCDVGQGWAIGKPAPGEAFIATFRNAVRIAS
jgi:EAL domain-containing protein (putative c-di-GMP-specific phosphodiesterase class I)